MEIEPAPKGRSTTTIRMMRFIESTAMESLQRHWCRQKTEHQEDEFISTFFTVPKPDGSHRFILNLIKFNEFVPIYHFKMEDLRTVINILEKGDYMCSIDLKDAYFLIPVCKESQKYLKFVWNDNVYQFLVLPFGLCTALYI
ncbi:unnamed protein product [Trichogramma brassicae]|uniref:Reverse transcriptase domain-containing protein n=1 Tax=Trichogramma brassicae TaxID=86971 RepID=A0A6H5IXX3_9HYME|nr:unnamed protein product [Trichogramma brassicae]